MYKSSIRDSFPDISSYYNGGWLKNFAKTKEPGLGIKGIHRTLVYVVRLMQLNPSVPDALPIPRSTLPEYSASSNVKFPTTFRGLWFGNIISPEPSPYILGMCNHVQT